MGFIWAGFQDRDVGGAGTPQSQAARSIALPALTKALWLDRAGSGRGKEAALGEEQNEPHDCLVPRRA